MFSALPRDSFIVCKFINVMKHCLIPITGHSTGCSRCLSPPGFTDDMSSFHITITSHQRYSRILAGHPTSMMSGGQSTAPTLTPSSPMMPLLDTVTVKVASPKMSSPPAHSICTSHMYSLVGKEVLQMGESTTMLVQQTLQCILAHATLLTQGSLTVVHFLCHTGECGTI